jgi:GNAT superfamily N-acetyltransferase
MTIQLATLEDFDAIDAFDRFGGDRILEINRQEIWIAILDNQVAGFATFDYSFYERPFLRYIIVNPEFRRKKVAEKLIVFIEQKCKNQKLFTSTEADNLPMISLLNKLKYRMVGIVHELQEVGEIFYCKEIN